jgi:hypothetical protein
VLARLQLGGVLLALVAQTGDLLLPERPLLSKFIFASKAIRSPAPVTTSGLISTRLASSSVYALYMPWRKVTA